MTKLEILDRTQQVILSLIPIEPESISSDDLWRRLEQEAIHKVSYRYRAAHQQWMRKLIRRGVVIPVYHHRYSRPNPFERTLRQEIQEANARIRAGFGKV